MGDGRVDVAAESTETLAQSNVAEPLAAQIRTRFLLRLAAEASLNESPVVVAFADILACDSITRTKILELVRASDASGHASAT